MGPGPKRAAALRLLLLATVEVVLSILNQADGVKRDPVGRGWIHKSAVDSLIVDHLAEDGDLFHGTPQGWRGTIRSRPMEIYKHGQAEDVVILAADGGLNSQTASELADQLLSRIDEGLTKLVVDCEHLEYVSTVGLSTLIRLHKRIRERGGEVHLCNLRGMIPEVMRVTRLERLFGIYGSVDEAVAGYSPT